MRIAMLMAGGNIHGRMVLEALLEAGAPLDLVIDERGTERAKKLESWLANDIDNPAPLAELIAQAGCEYKTVPHFQGRESETALLAFAPDYVINGGCGILSADFLALPRIGFLNAHPGLLPECRGVDPVLWSIAEKAEVGATVHLMSEGIDEGPIMLRAPLAPLPHVSSLLALRLACMRHGARLLARVLINPERYPPRVQDESRAHYFSGFPAERIAEAEAKLAAQLAAQKSQKRGLTS